MRTCPVLVGSLRLPLSPPGPVLGSPADTFTINSVSPLLHGSEMPVDHFWGQANHILSFIVVDEVQVL